MSTACKPIRDCGPEFGRRVERALQAEIRADERAAARRFSSRMFEIARDCNRFGRADAIQAECDRLLALSSPLIHQEDDMGLETIYPILTPRAAVPAAPARRPPPVTFRGMAARLRRRISAVIARAERLASTDTVHDGVNLIAGLAMGAFVTAIVIWAGAAAGGFR